MWSLIFNSDNKNFDLTMFIFIFTSEINHFSLKLKNNDRVLMNKLNKKVIKAD